MPGLEVANIAVRCRLRWWIWLYLEGVSFFCGLFGAEPDWSKVLAWVHRAMVLEVFVGGRWKRLA